MNIGSVSACRHMTKAWCARRSDSRLSSRCGARRQKQWIGPLQTARGWHFVRVEEIVEPHVMRFVDVREQVLRDWLDDKRSSSVNSRIAALKEKYDVEVER